LKYDYLISTECDEPILLFKINLIDSVTKEKFGDTLTGVCTVKKDPVIVMEPVRFSVTDE